MEIIGHRGARGLAPENTIEAIRAGIDAGVDMIEIDLRLDEHDKVVLAHDPVVYDVDYTTLEEVLDKVGTDFPLNIELKEPEVGLKLQPLLANYKARLVVSSYSSKALRIARVELPHAELAVLEKWSSIRAVYKARALRVQRIHMNQRWLWSGVVRRLRRGGFTIYGYTVNKRERADTLRSWGLNGIFTDTPNKFIHSDKKQR